MGEAWKERCLRLRYEELEKGRRTSPSRSSSRTRARTRTATRRTPLLSRRGRRAAKYGAKAWLGRATCLPSSHALRTHYMRAAPPCFSSLRLLPHAPHSAPAALRITFHTHSCARTRTLRLTHLSSPLTTPTLTARTSTRREANKGTTEEDNMIARS